MMKSNFWYIILIFILFLGCQNTRKLYGNYAACIDGEYTEVYFKKDSMRVASENVRVELSQWRKIEIKNDTLYFETFGEWRDKTKAKIKNVGMDNTELSFLETDAILNLERMNIKLNFMDSLKFWNGFNKRLNSKNCK